MARLAILIATALLVASPAGASNAVSLGYSGETTIVGPERECSVGTLFHNHDGSFENGYAWRYGGCQPPYFGAFGEGYDLGTGTAACGAFWLTTIMLYYPISSDCYVWEGGTESAPGAVLGVVADVWFESVPSWPTVAQNDIEMNIAVTGPFTIGCWGNWPGAGNAYFVAADENGPGGHPWTCIAPGQDYPSGWQNPAIVWPNAKSMGCGVYFEQGTPVESESWGSIKAFYR